MQTLCQVWFVACVVCFLAKEREGRESFFFSHSCYVNICVHFQTILPKKGEWKEKRRRKSVYLGRFGKLLTVLLLNLLQPAVGLREERRACEKEIWRHTQERDTERHLEL